ncbi:granzyme 1 [Labeo rohita]|uniref:Granzyme 1 n=1 Tax=Labeo rohita TaxID=84645 RepID=A0A498MLZ8_LABRO|nr:granzyme 1 [Labeo rohita]
MRDGIVGGKASIPHSRRYMVYIPEVILTCSHLIFYLGVDDTNFLPDGVEVDPIPHPEFIMNRPAHDIMFLKLKTPATLNKTVNTITFPENKTEKISKHCMVMGWGWQDYNNGSPSNVLKEANVTLIDSENCGTADTLCTEGSTGPAQGDSGGPLVCGGVVQGIVSFYKNSINGDKLAVYTHISHYLPWIKDNMKPLQQRQYETWKGKLDKIIHLMVYLGVNDTNLLPNGIEVDPIPHPEFNMGREGHDIMLLKLKTPVTLNKTVSTITLEKTVNEEISKDCMVMGWGWEKYHHRSPSDVLKEATVTLIDSKNCGTADTLCNEGSTGPAKGDSGGPLVCGGVAQGIVSYYQKKYNEEYLSVYTLISHYLPWIKANMKPLHQQQYETWKGKLDKIM